MRHALHVFLVLALSAAMAAATTVAPLEFSELVRRADMIFVGQVRAIAARGVSGAADGLIPHTVVEFAVLDAIDGVSSRTVTLDFPGGQLGDRTLVVPGTPSFRIGEQVALFAYSSSTATGQIVGVSQGLFRISVDPNGQRYVLRDDGTPLPSTAAVGQAAPLVSRDLIQPMRLEAFVSSIRQARQSIRR